MRAVICAQRHADAELLRPLIHAEAHHAVKTDRRQHCRSDSEDREQRRDKPIHAENLIVELCWGAAEIDR